jgi:hypothetical protein
MLVRHDVFPDSPDEIKRLISAPVLAVPGAGGN